MMPPGADQARCLADGFFSRVTRDIGEGLIDSKDDLIGIRDHHALLRLKSSGGDIKFVLGKFALSNITTRSNHTYWSAISISTNHHASTKNPFIAAILASHATFNFIS